ncbi:unnamed protein product [Cylicocyclus nassatus]|uniref:Uncharacterized protein n=1 Tax=Cylicocyclus nassatus TaxID=53992 RepID=A0AA36GH20_CYLNA|nr:unnamed protein product [Cylicocyclus nassatus]
MQTLLALLLSGLWHNVQSFHCNKIDPVPASQSNAELVRTENCRNDHACFTSVKDGRLTMGCFDSVKHWDHIALCFAKPDTETGCSYDKMTRLGFDNWGTGFCCCRSEKCNQLPPEWLALSSWRLRWRICSNFLIVATVFSFAFYGYGLLESQSRKTLGKKEKRGNGSWIS